MKLDTNTVCTLINLHSFGGPQYNGYDISGGIEDDSLYSWDKTYGTDTYDCFIKELSKKVTNYQAYHEDTHASIEKCAAIQAYTSGLQESAEQYLTKFGFINMFSLSCTRYPTPTSGWCISTDDFLLKLEEERERLNL